MRIFLDPGHNHAGADTGAQGHGLREQDVTFGIAEKLKAMLVSAGHSVKMSRNSVVENIGQTVSASIANRAMLANEWGAELFVSIHCNAYNGSVDGTETLVYSLGSGAVEKAKAVQEAIVQKLGTHDRGLKARPELGVLRLTKCPSMLIETAFIDHTEDAALLRDKQQEFAEAIFEGITGESIKREEKEEEALAQTVMKLPEQVYVQELNPAEFEIALCDCKKRSVDKGRYFNCGYFAAESGGKTVPVGNLASGGKIIAQAKDNPGWINVSGKALTTIYTTRDGKCGIIKTDRLDSIENLKTAVSGIPVIVGGKYVSYDKITAEGYFGNELYYTWHGFLGIRHGKLCYVAMRCDFDEMCWALVALGIYDAIKLDGGGSFILHDGKELIGTGENRRIHNVGVWSK